MPIDCDFLDADELHADQPEIVCGCCDDILHRNDVADLEEWTHADELVAKFGPVICNACADDHDLCADCGDLAALDGMSPSPIDGERICADCQNATPEAARCAMADDRAKQVCGG